MALVQPSNRTMMLTVKNRRNFFRRLSSAPPKGRCETIEDDKSPVSFPGERGGIKVLKTNPHPAAPRQMDLVQIIIKPANGSPTAAHCRRTHAHLSSESGHQRSKQLRQR